MWRPQAGGRRIALVLGAVGGGKGVDALVMALMDVTLLSADS